jgi:hypothetical protein
MKLVKISIWLLCSLILSTACTGATRATGTLLATSASFTEVVTTPMPTLEASFNQFKIPSCKGIEVQSQPLKFAWPNIEQRIKELEGASWGYYRCPQPQKEAAAFYRALMPKPPYNMVETNWVERAEGSVGVYFNAALNGWSYLWIVPVPGDDQSSYVIISQSDSPLPGGCS